MKKIPLVELQQRIDRLQQGMAAVGMDAAVLVQNADLFYFTGTVQQGFLYVPVEGEAVFFARKVLERVKSESALERIVPARSPKDVAKWIGDQELKAPTRLGMELDILPYNQYLRYQQAFGPAEIADVSAIVRSIRAVKSEYELGIIRDVARLSNFMVQTARGSLREGMTEIELSAAVEAASRIAGHQGFLRNRGFGGEVYWGHLISGADAALSTFADSPTGGRGLTRAFGQGSGYKVIKKNEPVVFDLVAGKNGYIVDQTRIMSIGPLPSKLDKAYRVAMEIMKELGAMIAPGVAAMELYQKAQDIADANGLGDHFMGYAEKAGFCGHGVGIELDELPVIVPGAKTRLAAGMVFALEPKFTFPGEGVVGVEDTFIVTASGSEKVTAADYRVEV
ncbi:MAG: aminopeptidase P family protein [Firmicutes bacterium]|nr:aminopeptidase P family protein [Bacillota bacterium]